MNSNLDLTPHRALAWDNYVDVVFREDLQSYRFVRHSIFKFSHFLLAQLDIKSSNVLQQVVGVLCAWDREDIIPLVMHPCQGQLPSLAPLSLCQLLHLTHQHLILQPTWIGMSNYRASKPEYLAALAVLWTYKAVYMPS